MLSADMNDMEIAGVVIPRAGVGAPLLVYFLDSQMCESSTSSRY
jgi:hypothetical protein